VIFIVVKWSIRPERSAEWLSLVEDFTKSTRAEPGNLFFEWSRSVDDPHEYVLVEAFADGQAGAAHVGSEHFRTAMAWMPDVVAAKPRIINVQVPGDGWSEMAEVTPRGS
jgi:quinol monooxygenase YgiN